MFLEFGSNREFGKFLEAFDSSARSDNYMGHIAVYWSEKNCGSSVLGHWATFP